ncbi:MAG: hypothetical protein D4R64_04810 [Porphyromonadaceae bacterium]|nr:MAG: hypothetical protein D4R64_04810 [Porphyromonadaceae bacterium]
MTSQQLKILKASLPMGYRDEIKLMTNFSLPYIDRVMRGDRYNQKIIDAAIYILAKRKAARKNSSSKFNRLMEGKASLIITAINLSALLCY